MKENGPFKKQRLLQWYIINSNGKFIFHDEGVWLNMGY